MSGSMVEVLKTTPRMGRRSMALADIDPKYVSQSGIWEASEVETSKGSIRIQHLTAVATSLRSVSVGSGVGSSIVGCGPPNNPRFPKLEECAHFHYDYVELPVLKILIREDTSKSITLPVDESTDKCAFAIEVSAGGQSWVIRRTHANFILLDEQLHRCVWDRSFSRLEQLKESLVGGDSDGVAPLSSANISNKGKRQASNSCANINAATSAAAAAAASRRRTTSAGGGVCEGLVSGDASADQQTSSQQQQNDHPDEEHNGCRDTIIGYLSRLAQLPTNKITCGTVLSWLELDNRGRHIVSSDDSDINTPAVAAACATRKYIAQAADELLLNVGDMISVIDMPPPEESIWLRGKRGFHVGFFPRDCVQVIGDKVPAGLPIVSSVRRLQRLSVSSAPSSSSSSSSSSASSVPKPVLRKHGKLIAFFRSFILSRPSRRRLKQSGILRERVFSCDLAEHLLNTGNDIPAVLKCCAEFIEKRGIVDGIYRLSGITSNIQKLRNLFDEDKTPNLEDDIAIKQDIHAVSSLQKMYFRELPNPLCTYQLYDKFVAAAQSSDEERLFKMREVVHELPPPHYRTLEYLMKHLARVAQRSNETGMTPKNMAIVWAPNLIRCKELEAGGVDALKGIGVQAVVTEYLVRHADLIFNDKLPANYPITTTVLSHKASCSSSGRPKSLAISSPIRLMSLEEAQDRQKQDDRKYIEVGGGPASLPPKYHTVIDLPSRRSALKNKRSPIGWRQFFSRNRSFSKPSSRKVSNPIEITVVTKSMPMAGPQGMQSNWVGRLRPVKSVESLVSSPMYTTNATTNGNCGSGNHLDHESVLEDAESNLSKSSPATPVMTDVDVIFHAAPIPPSEAARPLQNPKTHNRSISHDSYFEFGEFRNSNRVYIDETLEEETLSQSSKLSLEISSGGECSPTRKNEFAKVSSKNGKSGDTRRHGCMMSPVTPPPSAASLVVPTSTTIMSESVTSTSSDDVVSEQYTTPKSPLLPSKWRDSEVQTSHTKLYDVGVCTQEDMDHCANSNPVILSASTTATSLMSSGGQTTATTSCPVTRDSSEQSLLSHSSSGMEPMYELDRNSSVDDSSVDSTPCEPFATTNIIYSPLVDDLSSPASSGDHFRLGVDPFRVPSSAESEDASSANQTSRASNTKKGSSLYVCPLYEAGVSTTESLSSAVSVGTEVVTDVTTSVSGSVSPRVNQYENVSVINTNNRHQPNLQVFLCSSSLSQGLQHHQQEEKLQSPVAGHIYENHRLYENQPAPIPAIRKSKSEGAVMQAAIAQQNLQQSNTAPSTPTSAAVTNVQIDTDSVYEKFPKLYENVSEIEVKPSKAELEDMDDNEHLSHEANVYEDIDDDEDVDQNTGNKYETVEFEKGVMTSKESTPTPVSAHPIESDDEYEKIQESPIVIHHHYAEIEEKVEATCVSPEPQPQSSTTTLVIGANSAPTSPRQEEKEAGGASNLIPVIANSKSEDSSPSHSNTEDMVTYLEVQTPHLSLRNNSLDDQEDISQRSGSVGVGRGVSKLNKMNSLTSTSSSGTSENSPPGDEGEIRHIDSPVNSPVILETTPAPAIAPAGVDNPLYGIQHEENQDNVGSGESKDLEMQMSDGEDMSVNESISISISMEETTTPSSSASKRKQEALASTQNTSQDSGEILNGRELKLVSRCNSAPLAVGVHEFTVALERNEGMQSLQHGAELEGDDNDNDVFLSSRAPAARSISSTYGESGGDGQDDEIERRFGDKVLLCKRLSEPSLLFSNTNSSHTSSNLQKTDSSDIDNSNNLPIIVGGGNGSIGGNKGGHSAAWKIADAKRLSNRKKSVRELLSKFESKDSVSSTSPVQSPPLSGQFGALLPPTGLSGSRTEIGSSNTNIRENGGRSSSNNNLSNSSNNNGNARFHHHRFSTGDILMTQSMSVVENLSSILAPAMSATSNGNHLPSTNIIVRSDTFPELSRDDSSSKENALHGTFSMSERNGDDQPPEKAQCALRVAMSSVDMNDPSRRERIEKYKEERRSFLRQKINSELTGSSHQQKSPIEPLSPMNNGQIFPPPSYYSPENSSPAESLTESGPPSSNFSGSRASESPRKRAFSDDCPIGGTNTTTKSIKTDPFSLKCAFLASTTTMTTSTKMMESSGNSTTTSTETVSSTTVSSKSAESAEEINVRERVAMWSSTSSQTQKKETTSQSQPAAVVVGGGGGPRMQSSTTFTLPISTSNSNQNQIKVGSLVSTSTTEFPKVCKPLLRRELTTSAIEVSQTNNTNNSNKLTKVGRTNSEGTKKIKDMAAFFEGKRF